MFPLLLKVLNFNKDFDIKKGRKYSRFRIESSKTEDITDSDHSIC